MYILIWWIDAFRTNTLVLLSKGYSSIPLPAVQAYLGCSSEQVLYGEHFFPGHIYLFDPLTPCTAAASQNMWKYDASTQILSPVPILQGTGIGTKVILRSKCIIS